MDYPLDVYGATGQAINNHVIICGGKIYDIGYKNDCFMMGPKSTISLPNLEIAKAWTSSAVLRNALFVTGGKFYDKYSIYYNNTEYIAEGKRQTGVSMPIKVQSHCVIQVNENEIVLTGGYNSG